MKSSFDNIAAWARRHPDFGLALLALALTVFLVSPMFLSNMSTIGSWDESAYIHKGQILLDKGTWLPYAENPLVSMFYALIYLPLRNSPYWLIQASIAGRLLMFVLLWVATVLIARELKPYTRWWVMAGLFLVSPFTTSILHFPSDPLFAGLAALGFWQLLAFYRRGKCRNLAAASAFLGLAAHARNDGLLLFAIFVALVSFLVLTDRAPRGNWRRWARLALASLLPFAFLVGGYVLVYGAFTGDFSLGTMRRTYDNFESGQLAIYAGTGQINQSYEAHEEARRHFGTPEENHFSVFAAIRRNPQVYFQRLQAFAAAVPEHVLHAYGIRLAALIFLLAGRGVLFLAQRGEFRLLVLFLLWPAFLASSFLITLMREGHALFSFYILLALAAIGVVQMLNDLAFRRGQFAWLSLLLAIVLGTLAVNKLAVYYGAALLLAGLLVILAVRKFFSHELTFAFLVLLCVGVSLRSGFPGPSAYRLGTDPKEQAIIYLMENFPPDTPVAGGAPGVVWAAKMTYIGLGDLGVPKDQGFDGLVNWLYAQGVRAIFIDPAVYQDNPAVWALLKDQIGVRLERVFSADDGDIQILLLK
ncbi:MAG: hypothetical protein ACOYYS_01970 [Chloroflexota bacterium]